MRIISYILFLLSFLGCKTSKNIVLSRDPMPCSTMILPPNKEYIFNNWYKVDSSVCEVNSFKIKDLQAYKKGFFKNGKQSGRWISDRYYHTDSLGYNKTKKYLGREEHFKNGLREGSYKIYSKEGKIIYSTNFKNGDGIEKDFYDNGQLYYEIKTQNGYFTDTLKLYNPQGKIMKKLLYKKDSLVFERKYD